MKKIIILFPVILFAIVSCKKERTCECTQTETAVTTYSGGNSSTSVYSSTNKMTVDNQKKKFFRMNQGCYSSTSQVTETKTGYIRNTTTENTCTLK